MTAKEYLSQIQKMEYAIYMAEEEIIRMRQQLDLKGMNFKAEKVAASSKDITPEIIANLADLETVNDERRKQYEKLRSKILDQLEALDDHLDIAILYQRYIKGLNLYSIASKTKYSYNWIRHKHGVALQHFESKYGPF